MRILPLILTFILLIAVEVLRVYFIMPFPGSQKSDTLELAYLLDKNIVWIRGVLWAALAGAILLAKPFSRQALITTSVALLAYGIVFYLFNFRYLADHMFYQPRIKNFSGATDNRIPGGKLVLGVFINGTAKAYPLQLIGYHHQVRDTVGGEPVMVTYCTVCRSGRVFSPVVKGKVENFRLVGMDRFNAMFEDAGTGSWWRQVSGEAVAGPLKGEKLRELPSRQMSLAAWLALYPESLVMQPDSAFTDQYKNLEAYDAGKGNSDLVKRDTSSWKDKSWVIGLTCGTISRAHDWKRLAAARWLQDSLPGLDYLLVLEADSLSFHAYNRSLNGNRLNFTAKTDSGRLLLTDINTGSLWDVYGRCVAGKLKGGQLATVQAYQEFWHSWKTFHPNTLR